MFLPAGSDVLILWSAGTGITTLATMRLNSTSRLDSGRLLTGRMIHRAIGGLHARKRTGDETGDRTTSGFEQTTSGFEQTEPVEPARRGEQSTLACRPCM